MTVTRRTKVRAVSQTIMIVVVQPVAQERGVVDEVPVPVALLVVLAMQTQVKISVWI